MSQELFFLILILILIFIILIFNNKNSRKINNNLNNFKENDLGYFIEGFKNMFEENRNYWDKAFYITVDRFHDRQEYMENEFRKQNLEVKKYLGQDKRLIKDNLNKLVNDKYISKKLKNHKDINNGSLACLISHTSLYKKLLDEEGEVFLIFEDDSQILDNFKQNVKNYEKYFPEDWDMLWLGHGRLKGENINEYILKPKNNPGLGYNAQHHCYLIRKASIEKILDILLPADKFQPKDSILRNNFDKFNAYFLIPNLATQDRKTFRKSERETN